MPPPRRYVRCGVTLTFHRAEEQGPGRKARAATHWQRRAGPPQAQQSRTATNMRRLHAVNESPQARLAVGGAVEAQAAESGRGLIDGGFAKQEVLPGRRHTAGRASSANVPGATAGLPSSADARFRILAQLDDVYQVAAEFGKLGLDSSGRGLIELVPRNSRARRESSAPANASPPRQAPQPRRRSTATHRPAIKQTNNPNDRAYPSTSSKASEQKPHF